MLKIFLVEDEFVVREGIKRMDWAGHGYEFCGEASDGELALPLIARTRPDIVITDIRMPFMDGLELAEHLHKDFPEIEIIILSGFAEFDYARKAIALGVSRYLSKPISAAELMAEIDDLGHVIESRRQKRELAEQYRKDMEEDLQSKKRQFFQQMVSGRVSASSLLAQASELNLELNSTCYQVILCILSAGSASREDFARESTRIYAAMEAWEERYDRILFDRGEEGKAILLKGDSEEEVRAAFEQMCGQMETIAHECSSHRNTPMKYYLGAGIPVSRLSEIAKSFDLARAAFARRFFQPDSSIFYGVETAALTAEVGPSAIENIDPQAWNRAHVQEFLRVGEETEVDFFLDELFRSLESHALQSAMFRQYIAVDVYFLVSGFMTTLETEDGKTPGAPEMDVFHSLEALRAYCRNAITIGVEARNSVSRNKNRDVVETVARYIRENFADEELSLNTLADQAGFSPNHLSMIFSQQMGTTISKYLTDCRITKAKEALCCTNRKSAEIAESVGYKDPHYFSYMFKKATGMTPTQYRENKTNVSSEA